MKTHLNSRTASKVDIAPYWNIRIYIEESKLYDKGKLFQAIVFFLKDILENVYKKEYFIHVNICKDVDIDLSNGRVSVDKNNIFIDINLKAINLSSNIIYSSKLKSIFYVFLHETGHVLDIMRGCDKNDKSLEDAYVRHINLSQFQADNLPKDMSREEKWFYIETEVFADKFSFKNLAYFENLYCYEGAVIGLESPPTRKITIV